MSDEAIATAADAAAAPDAYVKLRVSAVVQESHDALSIVFDAPDEVEHFAYRPGQFLTLRIPVENGPVARCYSLASSPHLDEALKVTVKRVDGGLASHWLGDNLTAGAHLEVLAPAGIFTPRSLNENLLLVAGGSGVTPIISILKSALNEGSGKIAMIYANRDERSVIFAGELDTLARANPERLVVHHWLESVQGLPTVAQIAALAAPYSAHEAFICGPDKFMDAAVEALGVLGLDRKRIHVEKFVSLSQDPGLVPAPAIDNAPAEATTNLSVLFDGETHQIEWRSDMVLLDALLAAGVPAPYSCREGKCSACICKVSTGSASMLTNEALDAIDVADGWLLSCQAKPESPEIAVSFDE